MDAKTPLFPSAFDVKAPEGAEGWEGLYPYYTQFQPSRRKEDGNYEILSAEHVFRDYQFSTDNKVALPE